jgi:hypothetical protein
MSFLPVLTRLCHTAAGMITVWGAKTRVHPLEDGRFTGATRILAPHKVQLSFLAATLNESQVLGARG